MPLLRTPANIGAQDFPRAKNNSAELLTAGWSDARSEDLLGYDDDEGMHVDGACDISPNYYDPRTHAPDVTAPIPWNGFPRALDRWHRVLGDPTPDKQAQAEATADVVIEYLYWWEQGDDGKAYIGKTQAHLVDLLDAPQRGLARRARLGSATGAEVPMCFRQQDEYVEWHADHDNQGRLIRLSFTAEPPEYWTYLAAKEPDLVLDLYRELVGPQVQRDDLFFAEPLLIYGKDLAGNAQWLPMFKKDVYNRFNKWNSTHGAVHLTHWANTLGAEINLAAVASLVWRSDVVGPDPAYDDDNALTRIACAGYGEINRFSDPSIGERVGIQVVAGNRVSLTDPIGLYIGTIDLATLERNTPNGRARVLEKDVLTLKRGQDDAAHPRKLHVKLEAPKDADWILGDCFIDNRPLERGGQIARKISMALYADVLNGGADTAAKKCRTDLICRHPDSHGFFGTFDREEHPACADLEKKAWAQEIPNEQSTHLFKATFSTFGIELDAGLNTTLDALIEDPAASAPVGEELLAAPKISANRAKMP